MKMAEKKATQNDRRVQYLATLSVSLASLTLGVSSAWPTPVLPKLVGNETNIEINDDEIAWMLAMTPPGFIVGSLATRFVSDRLGRRAAVLTSAGPIAVGTIVVAFALKAWLLYLTRFLWGIGTGMLSTVMPMYLAEIADKEVRATLSLCTRVTFNLGNLLVMSIGMLVSYECLNYMMLVLPVSYFVACSWIPESPYYHLKEGRVDEARKQLKRIRHCKDDKELEDELTRMQDDVRREMRRSGSAKELFSGKQYRKAVFIVAGLKVTQIATGIIMIKQYLARIIQESKSPLNLSTVVIVFGVVQFVVGILTSILADRVGRRALLFYSLLGYGLSLAVVGVYFLLQEVVRIDQEALSPYGFIPFAGIMSSTIISTLGFNSIIGVIPAEIFPLNVKAVAMTSLSIFGGILGFAVTKGFQEVKNLWGLTGVFAVFTGVAFAGTLFVMAFVPETKGKSLKEIQVILQGDIYGYAEGEALNDLKHSDVGEANELKEIPYVKESNGKIL